MLMPLTKEESEMLKEVCWELGYMELLSQSTEECAEMIQAAQKVRRALKGTTPVLPAAAMESLCEEVADVLVCMETLEMTGIVSCEDVLKVAQKKIVRWHGRTCKQRGEKGDDKNG